MFDRLRLGGPAPAVEAETIRKGMSYTLRPVIRRYQLDHQIPDVIASSLERELRRYLIICALYPRRIVPMEGPVDDLWHILLTDTKLYAGFCQNVAGRFIDHLPNGKKRSRAQTLRDARLFQRLYRRTFGERPPLNWWPGVARLYAPIRPHTDGSRRSVRNPNSEGGESIDVTLTCGGHAGHGGGEGGGGH